MTFIIGPKQFNITAGKSYVGQTRPGGGGPGSGGTDVSWVPPVGYFADVPMTNMPTDVAPSFYQSGDMAHPFLYYGGSAYVPDYSTLGAQVYRSSGHENNSGEYNVQTTLVCDFSSLTWYAANNPSRANVIGAGDFNPATQCAADGSPYTPHTYQGVLNVPAAWGGGARGSILQCFWAGAAGGGFGQNRIFKCDLSQASGGYAELVTTQPENAQPTKISFGPNGADSAGSAPFAVEDYVKQGWWLNTLGDAPYVLFLSKTGTITQYAGLAGNNQDAALFLVPSMNLLIAADGGYTAGDYASNPPTGKRLYVLNTVTGARTNATTTGGEILTQAAGYDGPDLNYLAPKQLGLQWVEELGAAFGLDINEETGVARVVKLTPPITSPESGVWTWSVVPVQHWSTGDPSGSSALRVMSGGVLSKFKWIPTLHAFVYGARHNVKPQVIRI